MHDISFVSGLDMLFCIAFGFGVGFGIKFMFDYYKHEKKVDKIVDMIAAIGEFAVAMWCVTAIIRGVA